MKYNIDDIKLLKEHGQTVEDKGTFITSGHARVGYSAEEGLFTLSTRGYTFGRESLKELRKFLKSLEAKLAESE